MTNSTHSFVAGLALYLATLAPVFALSTGQVTLHSRLMQPLDAEIVLRDTRARTAGDIAVRLGSREDFQRLGIASTALPARLRFTLRRKQHQWVVRITSTRPIEQPYLVFPLRIEDRGVQRVERVTLLLDPPHPADPRATPRPEATGGRSATTHAAPQSSGDDASADRVRRLEARIAELRELLKFKDQQIATLESIIETQRLVADQLATPAPQPDADSRAASSIPPQPPATTAPPSARPPHDTAPAATDSHIVYWGLAGAIGLLLAALLTRWRLARHAPTTTATTSDRPRTSNPSRTPRRATGHTRTAAPSPSPSDPRPPAAVSNEQDELDSKLSASNLSLDLGRQRYQQEVSELWEQVDALDLDTGDSSFIDSSSLLTELDEENDQGLEILLEIARAHIELGDKEEANAILRKALDSADSEEKRSRIQTVLDEIA